MKLRFTILFVLFIQIIYSQKGDIDPNGYNKFYYGNGQISSEGHLKNGKPDGYWKTYYPDGIMKSEGNRKNFELDSTWVFYDEDGDTSKKINYRNGKKSGFFYIYEYNKDNEDKKSGGLISKEMYIDDIKQGKSYYYHPEKKYLKKIVNYSKNKKQGIAKTFSKDGQIITIEDYRNGVLIDREFINRYNTAGKKQGIWKEFYPNDKIKTEAVYQNGLLNGFYKEYDRLGGLTKILKYEKGKLVTENKNETDSLIKNNQVEKVFNARLKEEYYPNGRLKSIGAFNNDTIPVGEHKSYSEDGKTIRAKVYDDYGNILAKGYYNKNGKKHGKWWYYYQSGQIKKEGKYRNGKKTGVWKFYYQSGETEQLGKYINGQPDGKWEWFHENKQLEREENFINGLEHGKYVEYDEEGNVLEKGEYQEGLRTGYWYYNVGDHTEEGNYVLDQRDGLWKYYYDNGKLFFKGNYVQGQEDGKHKYYYYNGKLKKEGKYIFGSREGNWYFYNYEGEIIYKIKYKDNLEYKINGKKVEINKLD